MAGHCCGYWLGGGWFGGGWLNGGWLEVVGSEVADLVVVGSCLGVGYAMAWRAYHSVT